MCYTAPAIYLLLEFCWNSLLDSWLETAVRQPFINRHKAGISYPITWPFAGCCDVVVLKTMRWPSAGGHETAVYWMGMRQAFLTPRDSCLQSAVRWLFFFPWDTCNVPRPGIEPGSPDPKARIIPLDQKSGLEILAWILTLIDLHSFHFRWLHSRFLSGYYTTPVWRRPWDSYFRIGIRRSILAEGM